MNLRQFERRIRVLSEGIPENVERLVRKTAIAAHSAVSIATPVDTGRARANWILSINRPSDAKLKVSSSDSRGAGAFARSQAQAQERVTSFRLGQTVYITNNLPYIERLNEGWSAQAPARFVEQAVAQARALIANSRVVP